MMEANLYYYRAKVVSVYDGDSVTLDIDMGMGDWKHGKKCRLFGIDTPEIRGEERPEGLKVRDFVRMLLPVGAEVTILTHKDKSGKYGRLLITIFSVDQNINQLLLDEGLAEPFMV